jgi:hypothetical protein
VAVFVAAFLLELMLARAELFAEREWEEPSEADPDLVEALYSPEGRSAEAKIPRSR